MDNKKSGLITALVIGVLLAAFFIFGFLVSDYSGMPTSSTIANSGINTNDVNNDSGQQSADKVKQYLSKGAFNYPFVYNLTTESLSRVENSNIYNLTINFIVEPNPFNNGIYSVPENKDSIKKEMSLYITKNGDYFFTSQPQKTEINRNRR